MDEELDGRPPHLTWHYDPAEIMADGVIHGVGVCLGLAAAIVLVLLAWHAREAADFASVLVYATGLLAVLGISAAYNMWPVSPAKWLLRRFDHSAIYVLIAATYTPFMTQVRAGLTSAVLLLGIWVTAAAGVGLKLAAPGRFDGFSIVLYLALGWSGVLAYEAVVASLPTTTLWLIGAGGALYTVGVVFHLWSGLRFHNAIWHGFVLVAASLHYWAVLDCLILARV